MADLFSIELMRRIRNDDPAALRSLFDKWYTPLCRHALIFVGDEHTAEDIVQELFVKIWTQRKDMLIEKSVGSYLHRSVRNKCLNHIRDYDKRFVHDADPDSHPAEEISDDEDETMMKLYALALEGILELPERCRVIFNMSRQPGMTNRKLAEVLNLSIKTIENQNTIALRKLRSKLGPHLDKILHVGVFIIVNIFSWG
ncbi:MAG: RNA polymerase sigma-70 factor [Cyclonatronaceae bacterium]